MAFRGPDEEHLNPGYFLPESGRMFQGNIDYRKTSHQVRLFERIRLSAAGLGQDEAKLR